MFVQFHSMRQNSRTALISFEVIMPLHGWPHHIVHALLLQFQITAFSISRSLHPTLSKYIRIVGENKHYHCLNMDNQFRFSATCLVLQFTLICQLLLIHNSDWKLLRTNTLPSMASVGMKFRISSRKFTLICKILILKTYRQKFLNFKLYNGRKIRKNAY